MNDELKRFFTSIKFEGNDETFKTTSVLKVILKKQEELFEVNLYDKKVLPYDSVKNLFECAKNGINGDKKCAIKMHYEDVTEEDVLNYVKIFLKAVKLLLF